MAVKIITKSLLLLFILVGLNFIYTITLFKNDYNERSHELMEIDHAKGSTDMFYFGESSNTTVKETDSLNKSISEITQLFFPSLTLTTINKPATHAGIYKVWLKQLETNDSKPKAVIITLNLRSFDAAWINSPLETQLQESVIFARPYPNLMNRFSLSLSTKTDKEREREMLDAWQTTQLKFPFKFKYRTVRLWDDAMAQNGLSKKDGTRDEEKTVLACHYIKAYAFNINEHNPRIIDFDEITSWCSKNNIHLYLNLMAENCEYADSLVGKELVFLMKENRDYLVKRYHTKNCTVIDNLETVKGIDFIDQNWTTEHYNDKGRMAIAKNLASALNNQFSKKYKKAY